MGQKRQFICEILIVQLYPSCSLYSVPPLRCRSVHNPVEDGFIRFFYLHCQMLSHSQGNSCIVMNSTRSIAHQRSVLSRFDLCTTDPHGIQPIDLKVGHLLNPLFCSATLLKTFPDIENNLMHL
ncbi:unnamed protein product [Schistosoma rodhaini]|uniref:Uncharacterized protein n=1 Tax=Schistosoma rodhaini TaxID=6188 RepID=A0AA85GHD5_9TREM|nr:unnamed protein product [Schistosoma rodhaini]